MHVFTNGADAGYQRIATSEEEAVKRTKRFLVRGQQYEDGVLYGPSFLPRKERIFDMFFFRHMFDILQHRTLSTQIHILVIRGASVKLMEMFGLAHERDVSFFGSGGVMTGGAEEVNTWYTWKELSEELTKIGHPRILLTPLERLLLIIEDRESCRLAEIWFVFIMVVTVINLISMIFPHLPAEFARIVTQSGLFQIDPDTATDTFKFCCASAFSFEIAVKFMCMLVVRIELIDSDIALERITDDEPNAPPWNRGAKIKYFLVHGSHLVDFVAVVPFWLTCLFGNVLPNTTFFRMIRMARIFRVFKTARYLDMLQILGATLWKSIGMVVILFILFGVMGLVIGCLLYQLENDETFESVPHAVYWIFVRLLGVKDIPFRDGQVFTASGVILLTLTAALKGVLWIVPMEKIKQIYIDEYRAVTTMGDMRKDMDEHLTEKGKAGFALGHSTFARVLLEPLDLDIGGFEGDVNEVMVLHLMKQEEYSMEVDIQVPQCGGLLYVRAEWRPSPIMMKAKPPAMPDGLLTLRVVGAAGFPAQRGMRQRWRCIFQVPTQLFGTNSQEVVLCLADPVSFGTAQEFVVQWIEPDARMEQASALHAMDQPENLDQNTFMRRTLSLLQEQNVLIHDQGAKIDNQMRLIDEQRIRLERLETRLQERAGG